MLENRTWYRLLRKYLSEDRDWAAIHINCLILEESNVEQRPLLDIGSAFTWADTIQGHAYWQAIADRYYRKCRQTEEKEKVYAKVFE